MKIEVRGAVRRAVSAGLPVLAVVVALSGCEKRVELQLAPDARRASEIAAALASHGILVDRKPEKSGVMLSVESADFPRAMRALREAGLLRSARPSVDEALGKRGIAPTQLEERARHIHAIERELESTLMEIDGVIAARVSVVPPERPAPGASLASASASVLVKHSADVDLSPLVPGMARLVKNGVPGLAAEDDRHVTVMLVPEQRVVIAHPTAPVGSARSSVRTALQLALLVAGSMAVGFFLDRGLRRLRRRTVDGSADDVARSG
ncbi:EscJ/YscJ/HrcJ family type III secretion inner membrane ring protein [Trinickia sp. NRRL B-1857]|uniref:EscJ/YscJ/HrcJ family type III secretion inner membrane ring protein n=1 Tax=Trinickia sp. NRRL B-1857 TaxID=3162879 RepID=UPI003D2E636C